MRVHPIPKETWEPRREAILHQLSAAGAFDRIKLRDGVDSKDFEIACADAVVAFQFDWERQAKLTARLRAWEELAYRRIVRLPIPEDSPKYPIKQAVNSFLEERDYLLVSEDRRRRSRRLSLSQGSIDRLILDVYGVYRILADPRKPTREAFFSYHLPRIFKVALPGRKAPESGTSWQRVKRAGGVGLADLLGRTRMSMYPVLRSYMSAHSDSVHRYIRKLATRPSSQ